MKKKQLIRNLEIATNALEKYKDYMINGVKYAELALNQMLMIDAEDNIDKQKLNIAMEVLKYYARDEPFARGSFKAKDALREIEKIK